MTDGQRTANAAQITTPTDREIRVERIFEAPREPPGKPRVGARGEVRPRPACADLSFPAKDLESSFDPSFSWPCRRCRRRPAVSRATTGPTDLGRDPRAPPA